MMKDKVVDDIYLTFKFEVLLSEMTKYCYINN